VELFEEIRRGTQPARRSRAWPGSMAFTGGWCVRRLRARCRRSGKRPAGNSRGWGLSRNISSRGWRPTGKRRANNGTRRHRIWSRLREEQPELSIGEPTVRRFVAQRKRELGLAGREVFVPQSYQWGQEAQVDWFEATAKLGGERCALQSFAMRSMGDAFHRAYTNATQQAFIEAHELDFAYVEGVLPHPAL
jgi:hypothetical protein